MGSEALHMQVEHAVGYHLTDDEAAVKHQQDHELREWSHSHHHHEDWQEHAHDYIQASRTLIHRHAS